MLESSGTSSEQRSVGPVAGVEGVEDDRAGGGRRKSDGPNEAEGEQTVEQDEHGQTRLVKRRKCVVEGGSCKTVRARARSSAPSTKAGEDRQ